MIVLDQIRQNLINAIKQSGISQTEIAKRVGVSQQTISHYVKGDKLPALDTFVNLCLVLDVEPADILGFNDEQAKQIKHYTFNGETHNNNFN